MWRQCPVATFTQPLDNRVLFGEIIFGRGEHASGHAQAFALPVQAAFHRPFQDAWQFGEEVLLQHVVSVLSLKGQGQQVKAPTHRVVRILNCGPVVAHHDQLEGRAIGEEITPHEASRNRIAPSQRL